jgi:hypothetical protein
MKCYPALVETIPDVSPPALNKGAVLNGYIAVCERRSQTRSLTVVRAIGVDAMRIYIQQRGGGDAQS